METSKKNLGSKVDQSSVDYIQSPNNYVNVEENVESGQSLMSKRNNSVSHYFEPNSMRGSLNVGYRKNEVLRINKGNRKMLDQLR
jgi:hypothetical protein